MSTFLNLSPSISYLPCMHGILIRAAVWLPFANQNVSYIRTKIFSLVIIISNQMVVNSYGDYFYHAIHGNIYVLLKQFITFQLQIFITQYFKTGMYCYSWASSHHSTSIIIHYCIWHSKCTQTKYPTIHFTYRQYTACLVPVVLRQLTLLS